MLRKTTLLVVLAFGLGGAVAAAALHFELQERFTSGTRGQPAWEEVPWPFAIDQWGKGKAFRCKASNCGNQVNLYLRAKIGFCNCSTGVADDEELERISDLSLVAGAAAPIAAGREIAVAWMKGRSRAFSIQDGRSPQSALSVGFNDRCDAIIATAVIGDHAPLNLEPAVIEFLNSKRVLKWAEVTLGL